MEAAYLSVPDERSVKEGDAPASMLGFAWILVIACVYFGFDTSFSVGAAREAAMMLVGSSR